MTISALRPDATIDLPFRQFSRKTLSDDQLAALRTVCNLSRTVDDLIGGLEKLGVSLPDTSDEASKREFASVFKKKCGELFSYERLEQRKPLTVVTVLNVSVHLFGFVHGLKYASPEYKSEVLAYANEKLRSSTPLILAEEGMRCFLGDDRVREINALSYAIRCGVGSKAEFLRLIGGYFVYRIAAPVMGLRRPDDTLPIVSLRNALSKKCYETASDVHRNRFSARGFCSVTTPLFMDKAFNNFDQRMCTWRSGVFAYRIIKSALGMYDAQGRSESVSSEVLFLGGLRHEAEIAYFLQNPIDMAKYMVRPESFSPNPVNQVHTNGDHAGCKEVTRGEYELAVNMLDRIFAAAGCTFADDLQG